MTSLRFVVDSPKGPLPAQALGAQVEIIPVGKAGGRSIGRTRRFRWSASDGSSADVEPGSYFVRLELPSGETIEQDVTAVEGKTTEVLLTASASPHEWLAEYHYSGLVREKRHFRCLSLPDEPPKPAVFRVLHGFPFRWGDLGPVFRAGAVGGPAWQLAPVHWQQDGEHRFHLGTLPMTDKLVHLVIQAASGTWMSVAPGEWPGGHGQVQVLAPWDVEDGAPTTVVAAPEFAALSGWLSQGNLAAAAAVVKNPATRWLHGKVSNPYAAAAGAHLLNAVRSSFAPLDWLENLEEWFPWLPDGSVALATRRLRLAKGEADLDDVRTALRTAFERGIPLYTLGVSDLLDALLVLADSTPDLAAMLGPIRAITRRMRTDCVFTTFRMGD